MRSSINRRIRLYIAVFFLVRMWSVINRLQNWANPEAPSFALYLLHSIFSPLQGFCNSLVYGCNTRLRRQ